MGSGTRQSGRYVALGFAALWLQWTSCTVEEIDLSGKECPCADGWVCDEITGRCVEPVVSTGGGGGSDSGADAKLDANADQSVDAPIDGAGGSAPVVLGRACIGSQRSASMSNNRKRVSRFALFSQQTYESALFYLEPPTGAATQALRGIVYSVGANGQPDALVGATSEASIPASFPAGWVSMVFPAPLSLEPGEYWLGVHTGPSGTSKYAFEGVPAGARFADDTYSDGPAATFGQTTSGDYLLSVYLKPVGLVVDDKKACPLGTGGTGGTGGGGAGGTTGGGGGTGAKGGTGGTGATGGTSTGGTSAGGTSAGGTSTGGTSTGGTSAGGSGGTSTGGTSAGGSGGTSAGGSGGTSTSGGGTTGAGGTGGADAGTDSGG